MFTISALLLLCSCGDDDKTETLLPQEEEHHLISVSATTQDFTRSGEATLEDLKLNGFTVIAVNNSGRIYDNFPDTCTFTNGEWIWKHGYHLWPEKEQGEDEDGNPIDVYPPLDFYALYSPNGTAFFDWDEKTHIGDYIDIYSHLLGVAEDIMLATLTEYSYDSNPQAPGVLKFDFKHLLANVSINAKVKSIMEEDYDYYTVTANLWGQYYGVYYISDNYWDDNGMGESSIPVSFGGDGNDVHLNLNDATAQQLGSNRFVVPNPDDPSDYYTLKVRCYGHKTDDDPTEEGDLIQNLETTVNLNGCEGKNVVLNLTVDVHSDEIFIDTTTKHSSLDAPVVRNSFEN